MRQHRRAERKRFQFDLDELRKRSAADVAADLKEAAAAAMAQQNGRPLFPPGFVAPRGVIRLLGGQPLRRREAAFHPSTFPPAAIREK